MGAGVKEKNSEHAFGQRKNKSISSSECLFPLFASHG